MGGALGWDGSRGGRSGIRHGGGARGREGEVGGGVGLRITRKRTGGGHVRVVTGAVCSAGDDVLSLSVAPPVADEEQYTRVAVKGILYF